MERDAVDNPPAYTPEMRDLLTRLRIELNHLNTLNVIVHRYQGDFSIDADEANKRVEGATWLYLEHLKNNVRPLFVELGKQLAQRETRAVLSDNFTPTDLEYEHEGQKWYQGTYHTGVLW